MSALIRRLQPAELLGFARTFLISSIHTSSLPVIEETGLYGFRHLKTAKGFQSFVDDAIERSNELVDYISKLPAAPQIIEAMDEISDTVCSVIDSAELCRHTHPDREYVEEASKASLRINDYLHYLNTNHSIYNAVIKAEKDAHLLSDEAHRVAHHLRLDLERGGIHLCPERLEKVSKLSMDIVQLCREFNENIVTDPGHVDIFPASRIPKKWHHMCRAIHRPLQGTVRKSGPLNMMKEKGFRLVLEPGRLSSFLQGTSDDEVRKMAYIAGNSAPRANLRVLDDLIAARHEFSQLMGYSSYAAFALQPNMASSPDVVSSFLREMSEVVRPKADKEFNDIRKFKREHIGQVSADLEPWDETYFTGLMKSTAFQLDSSVVASYFPLSQCVEGLKVLSESLFGVTFHSISLAPGESWHPDVLKIALHHPDEGDIGYLYLDLKSRKDKHPLCAHFAIKGGRRISETAFQLPVVAVVCNFVGSNSSCPTLHHWEVETLFHEFGHALHSLFSRTDYQHFSGTRVVLDFAETPSNLFEYYAWDFRVLKTFTKHYSTGDTIPEALVKSMRTAKNMFYATELQRQIFYALIDQRLFGEQPLTARDSVTVVGELKREHTSWKHVDGTHWHTQFSHLASYGAGYYSYLYAKCFACTIWEKICEGEEEGPLSLSTGYALRTKFLRHGGAKDPSDILNDVVGEGVVRLRGEGGLVPDITSLIREIELSS